MTTETQILETAVLIVGAGPTGLALAAELWRRGVPAKLVDRLTAGTNESRAGVIHARTLEVLEPLDVTGALIEQGLKVPTFRVRDRDRALLHIDFDGLPTAFSFTLMCPQYRTERVLLARLEALGGSVERPCEFVRAQAQADHVEVELAGAQGTQRVRARWLVGCDGMHSQVREQAGIAFEGSSYEHSAVVADVRMDWPLSRDEVSLFCSPRGMAVVAPQPDDRFRIVMATDDAPAHPTLEFLQELLSQRGPREAGRIRELCWSSRFRTSHRVAQVARKGRVLLCGDAAHVHSPAGGQGMNTGIQDAMSLARVLSATLEDGREGRLDAWAVERQRVARDVVKFTDRMTRIATLKNAASTALRNAAIGVVASMPRARRAIAMNLAELNVH